MQAILPRLARSVARPFRALRIDGKGVHEAPLSEVIRKYGKSFDLPGDPNCLGYDQEFHQGLAVMAQQADLLDYVTAGNDAVALDKNMVITGILLVADPYRHDVTTATITAVQDAVDKVLSGLNIVGGPTYFQLNSTLAFLKAVSAMNKVVYGGSLPHEDLATGVAADNDSYQAWYIPLGAANDFDYFDITAGIPAEDETTLRLSGTFGADNLIATTAANGTVDSNTDIYVVLFGVAGLSADYRDRLPHPEFRHDHVTSPSSATTFNLQTKRYLKRTTILNLAVAASNNEARNDANLTDITMRFLKPVDSRLWDAVRWRIFKHSMLLGGHGPEADRDGSVALAGPGLDGVAVIDWRRFTKNPYGLDLMNLESGDAQISFTVGTTTGSIHLFNEYYTFPDPSVPLDWPPYRPI